MHEKKQKACGVEGQRNQKTMFYHISSTTQTLCM